MPSKCTDCLVSNEIFLTLLYFLKFWSRAVQCWVNFEQGIMTQLSLGTLRLLLTCNIVETVRHIALTDAVQSVYTAGFLLNHAQMAYATQICEWQLHNTLSVLTMREEVSTGQTLTFLLLLVYLLCCIQVGLILHRFENFSIENKFWRVKNWWAVFNNGKKFLAYVWKPNKCGSREETPKFSIITIAGFLWRHGTTTRQEVLTDSCNNCAYSLGQQKTFFTDATAQSGSWPLDD